MYSEIVCDNSSRMPISGRYVWIREGREDPAPADVNEATTTETKSSATQLRADAVVLMSRWAWRNSSEAVAGADRYRMHANVDERLLADGRIRVDGDEPIKRPLIQGHGSISRAQARRLAAESGVTLIATDHEGEPVGTLKVAPAFTKQHLRQLRARDRHCVLPGCSATRHFQGHRVQHREHGGRSDLQNGASTCGVTDCCTRVVSVSTDVE